MPLMTWDDTLSVKVKEIDGQHQKLVAMVNQLHDAMRRGEGHRELGAIIEDLVLYAKVHFATEERYFKQFGYPMTLPHIKEHAAFSSKVADFKVAYNSGRAAMTIDIMHFLSDWLRDHIGGSDSKYSACFARNGLN